MMQKLLYFHKIQEWIMVAVHFFFEAYDKAYDVHGITNGAVSQADLAAENLDLNQKFHWGISIDVAEHIPKDQIENFLKNIAKHTTDALLISW